MEEDEVINKDEEEEEYETIRNIEQNNSNNLLVNDGNWLEILEEWKIKRLYGLFYLLARIHFNSKYYIINKILESTDYFQVLNALNTDKIDNDTLSDK